LNVLTTMVIIAKKIVNGQHVRSKVTIQIIVDFLSIRELKIP